MAIIIVLIVLIVAFRLILEGYKREPTKYQRLENRFCYFAYIAIVLLAAFRGEMVGTDTAGYIADYMDVKMMSFTDIADRYEGYVGFYYLSKLFSMMGLPLFVWFGFLEIVLMSAMSRFINKYSKDKLYSIILFIVTGLFMFSLAGLKQTLAMALITHGYIDMAEDKRIRSIFWLVVAFFVHPASLIMLIAYLLSFIRKKEIFVIAFMLVFIAFSIGAKSTLSFLVALSGNEHFEMYLENDNSYTMSTLYLYLLIVLCTLPFLPQYLKMSINAKVEFVCVLICCLCQYMASFSPSLFRLALMFIPFLMVYTPNAFESSKNGSFSIILKVAALMGPIAFFIYSTRDTVYYMTF